MAKKGRSSEEILTTSSRLKSLVNKTNYLSQLNTKLPLLLPNPLAQHCTVANLRHSVLILYVDSASWGLQLRYLIPELLTQLRNQQASAHIGSIEYKIRPTEQAANPTQQAQPYLSKENKTLLAELQQLLQQTK